MGLLERVSGRTVHGGLTEPPEIQYNARTHFERVSLLSSHSPGMGEVTEQTAQS